jgi:transketolase
MATDPRKDFSSALMELGESCDLVLAISCDSGSGSGMNDFKAAYPERYIEVGISEQNAMDVAAGLAISGFIPVISAIAPFISMRCYEQVRNDVGYSNTNVKIIGSSSGLSHAPAGSTHQANEDMALMRTVPNIVIFNPGDGYEVKMSLKKAVEHEGPVYIRMPRHKLDEIAPEAERNFQIGKAEVMSEGDIMVIASGTLVNEAKNAVNKLRGEGMSIGLIDVHTVKPLDEDVIIKYAKSSKMLISVEEHSVIGGLGGAVAECIAPVASSAPLHIWGIACGAVNTGPYRELLADYGLTDEKLYERIKAIAK